MRILAGSWVVTGEPDAAPIASGALLLDAAERVLAIGTLADLRVRCADAVVEHHDAVLIPGLVNAHTHLELSALRGQVAGGRGFGPWVAAMVEARDGVSEQAQGDAIEAAVSELLAAGTAAVGEVTNTLRSLPALDGAPLLGCVFHEVYGLRRDTAETMLAMARSERAAVARWPDNLGYALAPHTLFTLHPEVLRSLLARVRQTRSLISLHLCEHGAERAYLRDGSGPFADFIAARGSHAVDWQPPGLDPVRYAQALGALGPDVLAVHLADAHDDELALVANAGAKVVLCPRSNLHIELKLPPLLAMLEVGLCPALGTDSLASCASLDVLEEARALSERFPSVAPRTLLAMATSYGARALGLDAQIGTLAVGKSPGVIAFDHDGVAPTEPERFVLSRRARVRRVLARPATQLASLQRSEPRPAASLEAR